MLQWRRLHIATIYILCKPNSTKWCVIWPTVLLLFVDAPFGTDCNTNTPIHLVATVFSIDFDQLLPICCLMCSNWTLIYDAKKWWCVLHKAHHIRLGAYSQVLSSVQLTPGIRHRGTWWVIGTVASLVLNTLLWYSSSFARLIGNLVYLLAWYSMARNDVSCAYARTDLSGQQHHCRLA